MIWWWWWRWCVYDDQCNIWFLEWWWWWWLAVGDTIGQELLQWSFPCTNYFLHTDQLYSSLKSFKGFLPSSWGVDFTLQENKSTEVQIDWVLHWNCNVCLKTQTTATSIGLEWWKLYNIISQKCFAETEGVKINIDGPLRNIDRSEWFPFSREKYWEENRSGTLDGN